jgi:hypothetical protein
MFVFQGRYLRWAKYVASGSGYDMFRAVRFIAADSKIYAVPGASGNNMPFLILVIDSLLGTIIVQS